MKQKRKIIRKNYRLTPLSRRIEQIKRIIWRGDIIDSGVSEIELPFSTDTELKAYLRGLEDAYDRVKNWQNFKW